MSDVLELLEYTGQRYVTSRIACLVATTFLIDQTFVDRGREELGFGISFFRHFFCHIAANS